MNFVLSSVLLLLFSNSLLANTDSSQNAAQHIQTNQIPSLEEKIEKITQHQLVMFENAPSYSLHQAIQQETILGEQLVQTIAKIQVIRRESVPLAIERSTELEQLLEDVVRIINTAVITASKVYVEQISPTGTITSVPRIATYTFFTSLLVSAIASAYVNDARMFGPGLLVAVLAVIVGGIDSVGSSTSLIIPKNIQKITIQSKLLLRSIRKNAVSRKALRAFFKPLKKASKLLEDNHLPPIPFFLSQNYLSALFQALQSQCSLLLDTSPANAAVSELSRNAALLDMEKVSVIRRAKLKE